MVTVFRACVLWLGCLAALPASSAFQPPSLLAPLAPRSPAHARISPPVPIPRPFASPHAPSLPRPSRRPRAAPLRMLSGDALRESAAVLLEAQGLAREESLEMVRGCSEVSEAPAGRDLIVEGRDVLGARSVYLVLLGEVTVLMDNRAYRSMVRGNFLGAARFVENETLKTLQQLRNSPLERMFADADADGSGGIDPEELQGMFCDQGVYISIGQAEKVIHMIDTNSDGVVSMEEATEAAAKLRSNTRTIFRDADKDGSASLDEQEIVETMNKVGLDLSEEQVEQVMAVFRRNWPRFSLSEAIEQADRINSPSQTLRKSFNEIDKDSNGMIDFEEFATLLQKLEVEIDPSQLEILFRSVDLNGDNAIDFLEFEASLDRVRERTIARFGNALRLYETVAYNTMKRKQITYKAGGGVAFIRWEWDALQSFFAEYPEAAVKIRDLWAVQGAFRALKQRDDGSEVGTSDTSADAGKQRVADYGYGGDFVYGKRGDYGPLDKAVPASLPTTAQWNFGREYRALRKAFKAGEYKEWVNAVSGARAWERARDGIQKLGEEGGGGGLRDAVKTAFLRMDKDGSGSLSTKEVYEGLNSVGIAVSEEDVGRMVAAADTDGVEGVSEVELQAMMSDIADGKAVMKTAFRQRGAWLPGFIAQPLVALLEYIGRLDDKQDQKLQANLRPYEAGETSDEMLTLRSKLSQLVLDNDAVWKREENRRDQIRAALDRAKQEKAASASGLTDYGDLVNKLSQTESPGIILGPYFLLCWLLDVLFTNRPIQRFWFLENVARMPYFSYSTMLALYEVLGWWRASSDARVIHFAEEWNEVQHLKMMEALGGDRLWLDRFLARHAAIFYYIILNHVWLFSPSIAYNFSELIEFHAVDTYGEFLDANEELLKSMPAPQEAVDYYENQNLFLFDEFQTGRDPSSRRPKINSLYDMFMQIRDDELEHVKTMFQCQTAEAQIVSPSSRKR